MIGREKQKQGRVKRERNEKDEGMTGKENNERNMCFDKGV